MITRACRALFLGLFLIIINAPTAAAEPTNLSLRKQEMAVYVGSGAYATEIASVALSANKYLAKRIAQGTKPDKKLAIVFDLDETLFSNLVHIMANDYGYVPKVWDAWVAKGQSPAMIPVQTIYDTARRGKIDIFIVTGRRETDRVATERNLREVGYEGWSKIFYKPESNEQPPGMAGFKTDIRRKLMQGGFTIVANVGDQASDLSNGYAERTFKLPNPFYLTK